MKTEKWMEKINKTKSFEKINKIHKPLARPATDKREETQTTNVRNESGDITTDSTDPAVLGQGGGAPGSHPDEPGGATPAPSNSAMDEDDITAELCWAFRKLCPFIPRICFWCLVSAPHCPVRKCGPRGLHYLCTTLRCRADTQLLGPR